MALVIMADSNSDIPYDHLDNMDIEMLYMPYFIDGEIRYHDMGRGGRTKEFFDAMRANRDVTTSMLNPYQYCEAFEPILRRGDDILFFCMSAALSSTMRNALLARKEMLEKYPGCRLEVVNSRGMSVGIALAAEAALEMRNQGMPLDEIIPAVDKIIAHQNYYLTVADLGYLRRSGRLTGAAALFGTMLHIKPLIQIDYQGRLVPAEKINGRKQALKTIAKRVAAHILNPAGQILHIAHADCLADAELLRGYCLALMPTLGGVDITFLGPVIAAHVGPGALGIIYQATDRSLDKVYQE